MKAIWIRSDERTIAEVEYGGLQDLKRMVGGWIELGKAWPSGDVLYVDEDGKLKGPRTFFVLPGVNDVFAGNGVVVGREIGDTAETADPALTVAALRAIVQFGVFG